MANILTIDTIMNEPRQIIISAEGRKKFLPFFPAKEIVINIPNPSIRKAQKMRQQYYAFVSAWVTKDQKLLARLSLDIVADVFKSCRPIFTKSWIKRCLTNEAFTQILDFILQPTKEKEEEYLKNALTLQKATEKQV
jgi:hypothetical protein